MSALSVQAKPDLRSFLREPKKFASNQRRLSRNFAEFGELNQNQLHQVKHWLLANLCFKKQTVQRISLAGLEQKSNGELVKIVKLNPRLRIICTGNPLVIANLECESFTDDEGNVFRVDVGFRRRQMKAVIERDGDCCVWCSMKLSYLHPQASLDHVIPAARGGSSSLRNSLLACRSCNGRRHHLSALTWLTICRASGMRIQMDAIFNRLDDLLNCVSDDVPFSGAICVT